MTTNIGTVDFAEIWRIAKQKMNKKLGNQEGEISGVTVTFTPISEADREARKALFGTQEESPAHECTAMPVNRRQDGNHLLRRLVLAGNLVATVLDMPNPSPRLKRDAQDAWDHAVADIRKDLVGAAAGRWTTTPGAQS